MHPREQNKRRISELHKALRWAGIGGPIPPEFAHCSLGTICAELRARMQLEFEYAVVDSPVLIVTTKPKPRIDPRLN